MIINIGIDNNIDNNIFILMNNFLGCSYKKIQFAYKF